MAASSRDPVIAEMEMLRLARMTAMTGCGAAT